MFKNFQKFKVLWKESSVSFFTVSFSTSRFVDNYYCLLQWCSFFYFKRPMYLPETVSLLTRSKLFVCIWNHVNCAFPVKGSSQKFQELVNGAHSMESKDVPDFKSENFQMATAESRLKLLKRIKIVCDTISLYNKVVTGVHYIGIFGAEDAGKSTFIKVNLIQIHNINLRAVTLISFSLVFN